MADTVIKVESLSKKYTLSHQQEGQGQYKTLRDVIADGTKSLVSKVQNPRSKIQNTSREEFWALKDVSFEIKQGDRVGIIGRNGAGKSTLLKILSRIVEPTLGSIEITGRVASLLEVGTGFHPELTGRENIFLNGAILGMGKAEIQRKFDEIVTFAEVEKFLDTPVKRYSSGMYVRLAFAVAAHLEPEILIVDEVLAVGDVSFQKKCLGKMNDVAKDGRTVIFVSHNMTAIQGLCSRAIWIHDGKVCEQGQPGQVISQYLKTSFSVLTEQTWTDQDQAPGNEQVRLHRVCVRPVDGSSQEQITVRTPFVFEFEYWNLQSEANLVLGLYLYNEEGILLFDISRVIEPDWQKNHVPLGLLRDQCHVPGDLLNDGMHRVEFFISKNQQMIYHLDNILLFEVQDSDDLRGDWYGEWQGAIRPILDWSTTMLENAKSKSF